MVPLHAERATFVQTSLIATSGIFPAKVNECATDHSHNNATEQLVTPVQHIATTADKSSMHIIAEQEARQLIVQCGGRI